MTNSFYANVYLFYMDTNAIAYIYHFISIDTFTKIIYEYKYNY